MKENVPHPGHLTARDELETDWKLRSIAVKIRDQSTGPGLLSLSLVLTHGTGTRSPGTDVCEAEALPQALHERFAQEPSKSSVNNLEQPGGPGAICSVVQGRLQRRGIYFEPVQSLDAKISGSARGTLPTSLDLLLLRS